MAARKTVRDRRRKAAHLRLSRGNARFDPGYQAEADAFVQANNLGCFKCGRKDTAWHKTGRQNTGKPWALCTLCAKGPR